jgi:zinc protease
MKKQIFLMVYFITTAAFATPATTIERWKTIQGTPVVFYQAMDVPMLDIHVAFHAGSAHDGAQFGLSALTTRLLNQGNAGLDAGTIADQFAEVGAQYVSESTRDSIILSLKTVSEPKARFQAINTLRRVMGHPDFPKDAFDREKNQQRLAIQQVQDSPDAVADITFYQALYRDHPYAHPIDGTEPTVNALRRQDVQQFYNQFMVSQNAVIVLVGAIDKSTAVQIANDLMHDLPLGQKAPPTPRAKALPEEMNIEVPFTASQTVLRLGQLGIDHKDPAYFPLLVGNYTLGGGNLVSWLATELREKRGLTYGAYSQFIPMPGLGPFTIHLSTKQTKTQEAQTITRETLLRFIQSGPSEQELIAAKSYLTGSFPLSLASNRNMAHVLLSMAFYELPNDYLDTYIKRIQAVKREDIQRAFQQHLMPKRLLDVQVGNG